MSNHLANRHDPITKDEPNPQPKMTLPLNPAMAATFAPPVMEARRWLAGATFTTERPLINVSQAAPVDSPPLGLRQAIADAALNNPDAHLYGPVLGLPALRAEIASQWSHAYHGSISPSQVAITQGCNQAFTAVMSTLAGAGDAVILPTPWYFNHKMWLDMQGVSTIPLPTGHTLIPNAKDAEKLITPRTKAIVLVSPKSKHMQLNAIDFDIDATPESLENLCNAWKTLGPELKLGLGFYTPTRIHLDTQGFRSWGSDHTHKTSLCLQEK